MQELSQKHIDLLFNIAKLLTGKMSSPEAKTKIAGLLEEIETDRAQVETHHHESDLGNVEGLEKADSKPAQHHRR